jgi:hypothetical protein
VGTDILITFVQGTGIPIVAISARAALTAHIFALNTNPGFAIVILFALDAGKNRFKTGPTLTLVISEAADAGFERGVAEPKFTVRIVHARYTDVLFHITDETVTAVPFIVAAHPANGKRRVTEFSVRAVFILCAFVVATGFIGDVLRGRDRRFTFVCLTSSC